MSKKFYLPKPSAVRVLCGIIFWIGAQSNIKKMAKKSMVSNKNQFYLLIADGGKSQLCCTNIDTFISHRILNQLRVFVMRKEKGIASYGLGIRWFAKLDDAK